MKPGARKAELHYVELIEVGSRLRSVSEDAVDRMAESMREIGLRTPITVRFAEDDEAQHLILVTGATRLAAAKKLGWEQIECFVTEEDEIDAELWEIDENLARAELTASQEAEHLARRKALWAERQKRDAEKSGKSFPTSGRGNEGFAASTAAITGETKRSINQKIARAEAVAPDVRKEIEGTHLDTGTYLEKLKRLSPEEQREKVKADLLAGPRPRAVRKPISPSDPPRNDFELINQEHRALVRAWEGAREEARQRFLDDIGAVIDRPVFDATSVGEGSNDRPFAERDATP